MAKKTLNQILGANLQALMTARGLSANSLGQAAGVAPNTIGNYLKAASAAATGQPAPTSGKERSAKLAEVELIAAALNLSPLELLTDPEAKAEETRRLIAKVTATIAGMPTTSDQLEMPLRLSRKPPKAAAA